MAGLVTLRVSARNLLRSNRLKNIFGISFWMTDLGYEPRLLQLISRHTITRPWRLPMEMFTEVPIFALR